MDNLQPATCDPPLYWRVADPSVQGVHLPIPRRIIQTGRDFRLPVLNRATVSSMRTLNPDFEYQFFGNEEVEQFIDQEFPQYRVIFDSFRFPIQRYDFFRYLAVYRYGGFYFDLDVLLASSLSGLLSCGCVFPFERIMISRFMRDDVGIDWQVGNYAFGATAGHPFLEAVITNCIRAQQDPGWVKPMIRGTPRLRRDDYLVLNSTGPGLVTRTLAQIPEVASTVTVLFPEDVCDVGQWNRFGEYGIHLMESSWRRSRNALHQKITNLTCDYIQSRRIRESQKRGKSRQHPSIRSGA